MNPERDTWREPQLPAFVSRLIWLEEVDSTNDHAKRLLSAGEMGHGGVVLADRQTRGRGRLARTWDSPGGVGLWMSMVLEPNRRTSEWFLYTFLAALTVAEAIEETTGLSVQLKWPNDVMLAGKKCCGILLETTTRLEAPFVILGIGINVNQVDFSSELRPVATSIRLALGRETSRASLFQRWAECFARDWYRVDASILAKWKAKSDMWGRTVRVLQSGTGLRGIAKGLAPDGALVVDVSGEEKKIYAGDVKVEMATD